MIELVLTMLTKTLNLNESDGEIRCLMKTDWNLFEFVSGLIQKLSSGMKFGGQGAYRDDYRKEIKVLILFLSHSSDPQVLIILQTCAAKSGM